MLLLLDCCFFWLNTSSRSLDRRAHTTRKCDNNNNHPVRHQNYNSNNRQKKIMIDGRGTSKGCVMHECALENKPGSVTMTALHNRLCICELLFSLHRLAQTAKCVCAPKSAFMRICRFLCGVY